VHRLQLHPIEHNKRAYPTIPPSYIRVHAVVWECSEGQTDRHTDDVTNTIFASATPHQIATKKHIDTKKTKPNTNKLVVVKLKMQESKKPKLCI